VAVSGTLWHTGTSLSQYVVCTVAQWHMAVSGTLWPTGTYLSECVMCTVAQWHMAVSRTLWHTGTSLSECVMCTVAQWHMAVSGTLGHIGTSLSECVVCTVAQWHMAVSGMLWHTGTSLHWSASNCLLFIWETPWRYGETSQWMHDYLLTSTMTLSRRVTAIVNSECTQNRMSVPLAYVIVVRRCAVRRPYCNMCVCVCVERQHVTDARCWSRTLRRCWVVTTTARRHWRTKSGLHQSTLCLSVCLGEREW